MRPEHVERRLERGAALRSVFRDGSAAAARDFLSEPHVWVRMEGRRNVCRRTARELLSAATALERVEPLGPLPRLAPVRPSG